MIYQTRMGKMISFRVPEEDYQKLLRLCEETNVRSLSELGRIAMQHWLRHGSARSAVNLQRKVEELEQRVAELSAQLEVLCDAAGPVR